MFSSSPIEQSSTMSDVEPEEMNGSGTPVSGARPRTAYTLSSRPSEHRRTISAVEPEEMNGSGTPVSGARPSTA